MSSPTRSSSSKVLAVLSTLAVLGIGAAVRPDLAVSMAALVQARDTVPGADLRCLTRRPGDCLDEPVPRDEPHGANCATCHNLWDPNVPATVTRSCTSSGCHSSGAELSNFHKTIHPESLTDCLHCHTAHDFRVPESGNECSACHKGGGIEVSWVDAASTHGLSAPAAFTHGDHGQVECSACHGTGEQHGTLEVVTLEDCRSCHHRSPVSSNCTACHAPEGLAGRPLMVTRALDIRIGSLDLPLRLLPFDHSYHLEIDCAQCHTQGSNLRAAGGADCSGCHAEHHLPDATCSTCHEPPAAGAHGTEVHMGCSGAGCHDSAPAGIRDAPRTRSLCLACHTEMTEHKPQKTCSDCHLLPEPGRP